MTNKTTHVIHIINMCLTIISSVFILIAILIALMTIDPVVTLLAAGGFGLIYLFIIRITYAKVASNSERIARESTNVIKTLQEGLGGIRDVLIDGTQNEYCEMYRRCDLPLRVAQGSNAFIGSSPRFGMEALGLAFIAALAYFLTQQADGVAKAMPIIGALALGAQRLLPILQQTYSAWTGIQSGRASLKDSLELLDQSLPADEYLAISDPIPFTRELTLKQISFRYTPAAPLVLREIDLSIQKGSRVGFIGTTGSGKSTLLDLVMGLLQPSEGALAVDDQIIDLSRSHAWQKHIAHVPQAIFLADTTIEENIAFGVPKEKIQRTRIEQVARQAQIADTIHAWPKQYETMVGERGVRLSGGQRQRIGIARALYKQADVIIFDEATSALDNITEAAVMSSIDGLARDLTLLIVAHRVSTLKKCDLIVELTNGAISRVGSYSEIFGSQSFDE
jgi:ATP-binding cassette subfamily B protein